MAPYIHHAPGRVRIKSQILKKNTRRSNLLKAIYLEHDGVSDVTLNITNGSIVVRYDPTTIQHQSILALASRYIEGISIEDGKSAIGKTTIHRSADAKFSATNLSIKAANTQSTRHALGFGKGLAARAGNIAIGFLIEKGVRYSMSNILGLR